MKAKTETKAFREGVTDSLAKGQVTVPTGDPTYNTKLAAAKDTFAKPWTKATGGYEASLMQLYENRPTPLTQESSATFKYKVNGTDTPVTNAEGLTHYVLETFTKMGMGARLPDGDEAERATVPCGNSIHTFALKPGSSALATMLKQGKKPAEFIEEFKEVEGKKNEKRRNAELPITDLSTGARGRHDPVRGLDLSRERPGR